MKNSWELVLTHYHKDGTAVSYSGAVSDKQLERGTIDPIVLFTHISRCCYNAILEHKLKEKPNE